MLLIDIIMGCCGAPEQPITTLAELQAVPRLPGRLHFLELYSDNAICARQHKLWQEHTQSRANRLQLLRVCVDGADPAIMAHFEVESTPCLFLVEGRWDKPSVKAQLLGFSEPRLVDFIEEAFR